MNWKVRIQKLSAWPTVHHAYAFLAQVPGIRAVVRNLARSFVPPDTRVWVRNPAGLGKGLELLLDPRFETEYASGKYEQHVQEVLSQHLKRGSVLYDVGAHIGVLSMFARELVGSSGMIFAFEADPENAQRIREQVQRNRLDRIEVVPCPVWSCAGQVRFQRAGALSSRNEGRVATESGQANEDILVLDSISLDGFAEQHLAPTVVKIDVEGAEAEVLRGSDQIFSQARPVLVCEIHNREAEKAVNRWLATKDYSFRWIEACEKLPRHLLATFRGTELGR